MTETALFAHALLRLEGVGRVTAHRLLAAFPTYATLRGTPREQVLVRLKNVPNANQTVTKLFDEAVMLPLLAAARDELSNLQARHILATAPGDPGWPKTLDALDRAHRPVLLYTYGALALLHQPMLALLNRPPISKAAFDVAEDLARYAKQHGLYLATNLATGFDKVMSQVSASPPEARPTIMVLNCGLAQVEKSLRPVASAMTKRGGVLCSPFPLHHGPYEHDDTERARLQTALAVASVCFDPRRDTPEWRAMEWALEMKRPVFGVCEADDTELPQGAIPIKSSVDFGWILQAIRSARS